MKYAPLTGTVRQRLRGPKRYLTRLLCVTKDMPPWTNRLYPDVSARFRLSTSPEGSTVPCPKLALVATICHLYSYWYGICLVNPTNPTPRNAGPIGVM